jgi:septal ring factor EnvC (AmiA/AmiB activator)
VKRFFVSLILLCATTLLFADELSKVQEKIHQTKALLSSQQEAQAKAMVSLKKLDLSINTIGKSLRKTQQQVSLAQQKLNGLKKEEAVLLKNIIDQKNALFAELSIVYQLPEKGFLERLINGESFNTASRNRLYYRYIALNREVQIKSLQEKLNALNVLKIEIKSQQSVLTSLAGEKASQRSALQKEERVRKKTVTALKKQVQSTKGKLQQLEKNARDLQALINRLSQKKLSLSTESLSWTLPIKGKITQRYGDALQGTLKSQGVFIAAPGGENVVAINEGQVLFADWMRGYGLIVIVEHPGNMLSLYAHCDSLLIEAGDVVQKNEPIALSGNSGGFSQTGLYFEVRKNGKPVNPVKY